jgi:hypothetical protein
MCGWQFGACHLFMNMQECTKWKMKNPRSVDGFIVFLNPFLSLANKQSVRHYYCLLHVLPGGPLDLIPSISLERTNNENLVSFSYQHHSSSGLSWELCLWQLHRLQKQSFNIFYPNTEHFQLVPVYAVFTEVKYGNLISHNSILVRWSLKLAIVIFYYLGCAMKIAHIWCKKSFSVSCLHR